MTMPTAVQFYKPQNKREKIVRQAQCPRHGVATSHWLAVQPSLLDDDATHYWLFSCDSMLTAPHTFLALPDPLVPEDAEGVAVWVEAQIAGELAEKEARKAKRKK